MLLEKLFTPMKINGCEISNRFVVPAMVVNYCNYNGTLTEKFIAYHEAKAKGGWGLIITEDYGVNKNAGGYDRIPGLWNDEQIEKNIEFTDRIHKLGSKVFCQIYHAGRQAHQGVNGGVQPMAPSPIPCAIKRELPRALRVDEIKQIIEDFGDCALRAKKAGFDGVEIHSGHGYLLAEFLSPYSNKRTDEYGGCLTNRVRIVHEIIDNIRSKVGREFPLTIRFSADEDVDGGRTMAETRILAKMFEEWGIDAIHMSTGCYGSYDKGVVSTMYVDYAWTVDYAEEIRQLINIPVIAVNHINDPLMAESILDAGKADFIAMGRASLADPDLPNKAKAGQFDDIRYCIGCLQGCIYLEESEHGSTCLVNPSLGYEEVLDYSTVESPKKVVVIGGGPGGLEAARSAALKGHHVKLYEKQEFLGGQFVSAAYPPCKGGLATYTAWMIKQLSKLNLEIVLNCEATAEMIKKDNPDVVIIASGGKPVIPTAIPGSDKPHVHTAEDVLLGRVQPGNCNVIIGGGEVGCETAAHLAMQFRGATVIEMESRILRDAPLAAQLDRLMKKWGCQVHVSTRLVAIEDDAVVVEDIEGERRRLPSDMVVLALGYRPNNVLIETLKDINAEIVSIGGAVRTSNALVAISEGFHTGINI